MAKEQTHSQFQFWHKIGRRDLLLGLTALVTVQMSRSRFVQAASPKHLFTLGVASGDPLPDGFVLWTRLAPAPLQGGGMPQKAVPVQWQVATDAAMRQVIRRGTAMATPQFAHSVHVEVTGLEPNRWYWYQFRVGSELSQIGRTRTAPVLNSPVDRLRFAFASCQNYEHGYYTAYRDMAKQDLDFVVHLGDYIYEGGATPGRPRQHNGSECISLEQYRDRYALYKTDLDLQAAHAAFAWIVTWDDHEVANNYANLTTQNPRDQATFAQRRANAYQAYYEHMPLRRSSSPQGADLQLYRRFYFGNLAALHVLDTRQYRSDQPCGDGVKPRCTEAFASEATLMGHTQERWLFDGLSRSSAQWNVLAQQVVMAQFKVSLKGNEVFNLDQWDGYVAARHRLFQFLSDRKPANPIVISGDVHASWVYDLKVDFDDPNSEPIATEFAGTSISSNFAEANIPLVEASLPNNPHTHFFNGAFRGYVICNLTPQQWRSDFRAVSTVQTPNGTVSTLASFVVEAGKAGARQV
ncbi:MAG: alkaline phosphatase D family protein [Scytolyngbya sp. HA4215-MV1]|jgi:alkaline phosphatase D|nr:alkaline phosphatase D family protein [Scytolyngbya sp. HA4215-MV1]